MPDRLDELLTMNRHLSPAEEAEGERLWAEKHGKPYTPRPIPKSQEQRIAEYQAAKPEKAWTIEFLPAGNGFHDFPGVYIEGPSLGPYCHLYAFPEDWDNYDVPEDKKREIRELFDANVEASRAPVDANHHWNTKLRGVEGAKEHHIWTRSMCRW